MAWFIINPCESDIIHSGRKGMHWGIRNGPPYPIDRSKLQKNVPKNTKELKGYKEKCYFISEKDLDGTTVKPRVPSNFLTEYGYEDSETRRVCFSDDVGKCLTALSQNVKGKTYTVYEPDDISKYTVYKPNKKAVPDSEITGELWITDPVKLKKVGSIYVTGDDGKDGMDYTYGKNTATLYGWNYYWIKK